ncbi:MAG: hypothetical protein JNM91_05810 [Flavobacteriales bacterium]|nr:hypothetical protein [Flavobacteriales bacterium]
MNGTFETAGTATLIHLRLGLHPLVVIFMSFWMGIVGLAFLGITISSINSMVFNPVMLVPGCMFMFGYALVMGGFLHERGRTLNAFKDLLSAERVDLVRR